MAAIPWPQQSRGEMAHPGPSVPSQDLLPLPFSLPSPCNHPRSSSLPAGDQGAGRGGVERWGTGRDLLCCLLLLLLPGLQQSLHHHLGAMLLVQGPEVLIFQGAPVAKDGQPGAGRWPHMGAEFSSLELGPGCPERRGSLGRCLRYCPREQAGGHCLPPQVLISGPFSPSSPDAPLTPGSW